MVKERVEIPSFEVPPYVPPTPEELKRRQEVGRRILEHRAKMQPLGFSVAELIREIRDEDDDAESGQGIPSSALMKG